MVHPTLSCLTVACLVAGCSATSGRRAYTPQVRHITVTTVPLLVRETASVYPFLKADFAKGGVLDGKEVYAFDPNTITVIQGDTIDFTFYNPEDDLHSFVMTGFNVPLAPQKVTHATYVATKVGIFPFLCAIPSHLPMMSGQLVVLSPEAIGIEQD